MDFSRRFFLSVGFAGVMAPLISHAAEEMVIPTPAEAKMIAFMKDHDVAHFMMLNKQRGLLLYIVNSRITDAAPVLSGKMKGDNRRENLGVTPSGIFKLETLDDSDSIGFKKVKGTSIYYTIHPVLDIPGQRREERLESMRPAWQRISSGCVNVALHTIANIRGMMTMPQTFKDDKSAQQVTGSFFVVLPELKPVESIFKYPEINAP
ncbi:MAG: hypothetical protein A3B66_09575 [Alphaproteobacteria bacterium RIFCSPHIGHO2_02_FULL_46_13]|nr:MAG: hypothetical protein A3B66_09575 [Alphaproteobacteria bacterium RIFCSPHIGHO2_02_FULL_46_13]